VNLSGIMTEYKVPDYLRNVDYRFRTGEVGKILSLSLSKINSCVDNGSLRGYRIPGSRHRRVVNMGEKGLIDFIEEHELPFDRLELFFLNEGLITHDPNK